MVKLLDLRFCKWKGRILFNAEGILAATDGRKVTVDCKVLPHDSLYEVF